MRSILLAALSCLVVVPAQPFASGQSCVGLNPYVLVCQEPDELLPNELRVDAAGEGLRAGVYEDPDGSYAAVHRGSTPVVEAWIKSLEGGVLNNYQANVQDVAFVEAFLIGHGPTYAAMQAKQGGTQGDALVFVTIEHQAFPNADFYGVCIGEGADDPMRRCAGVGAPIPLPLP